MTFNTYPANISLKKEQFKIYPQLPRFSNSYNNAVLSDNPIRYWKLNDQLGNIAIDSSGQNGHATFNETVGLKKESLSPTDNEFSSEFNGIDSLVYFTNPLQNTSYMSIECLIKISSVPVKGCIINIGDNYSGFGLGVGGDTFDSPGDNNCVVGLLNIVSWLPTYSVIPIGINHIGMVASFNRPDYNLFTFYLNGQLCSQTGTYSNMKPPSVDGSIGGQFIGSPGSFRAVPALISKVALYNYELPPERWAAHNAAR